MGGARRGAYRAVVTVDCRGYESVAKIGCSGSSEKMGRGCRGRVTQLDSALLFLRVRSVIVGTRQHSLEGRWQRAALSLLPEVWPGPLAHKFPNGRRLIRRLCNMAHVAR